MFLNKLKKIEKNFLFDSNLKKEKDGLLGIKLVNLFCGSNDKLIRG
jgi:hypothetical protein